MSDQAPIIIKRKKVIQGGGHHGGAWKVAYADFVTAMMAFFLLMWLLGATTEDQRKGIADYFNTTIPIAATSGGGTDALSGDSILTEQRMSRSGDFQSVNARKSITTQEELLEEQITKRAEKAGLVDAEGRIRVRKTEEGTLIELVDSEGNALFGTGSFEPSADLRIMIQSISDTIKASNAPVKITGHTDALAYSGNGYTNWELSADRANTTRRMLLGMGVPVRQIDEVSGRADREPISENPNDPVNRRIAITLKGV